MKETITDRRNTHSHPDSSGGLSTVEQALLDLGEKKSRALLKKLFGDSDESGAVELTPEMAEEAITTLKEEFNKTPEERKRNYYRIQEGMNFDEVEAALRAEENKEVLTSVWRMIKEGSCPAVVCEEDGKFCIAETFIETLSQRANCVYNPEAEDYIGAHLCNGNAVMQAEKMGVSLVEPRIAQAYLEFELMKDHSYPCHDYIQATEWQCKNDLAPFIIRGFERALISESHNHAYHANRGWRGMVWLKKV